MTTTPSPLLYSSPVYTHPFMFCLPFSFYSISAFVCARTWMRLCVSSFKLQSCQFGCSVAFRVNKYRIGWSVIDPAASPCTRWPRSHVHFLLSRVSFLKVQSAVIRFTVGTVQPAHTRTSHRWTSSTEEMYTLTFVCQSRLLDTARTDRGPIVYSKHERRCFFMRFRLHVRTVLGV